MWDQLGAGAGELGTGREWPGPGCGSEKSVVAATRDQWIVVAKRINFEHHDEDSEGDFVGRVAWVVAPARGTNLADAMHEERKNGHVPERRDSIFIRVLGHHTFVDTDARAGVSAIGA